MEKLPELRNYTLEEIDSAFSHLEKELIDSRGGVEDFRIFWLGRKSGVLTVLREKWLAAAPKEKKRELGMRFNAFKDEVERRIAMYELGELGETQSVADETASTLVSIKRAEAFEKKLASERIDVTLPGTRRALGVEHPIIRTMNEFVAVFKAMGYSVAEGPEVETDWLNFGALNFPPNHPARDTQDTLFVAGQQKKPLNDRLLLRTHTSPVQIRAMMQSPPPLRIVCPGKVHRRDAPDATHSPMFHQIEALAVDTNITFSDLKGTIDHAMKMLFGSSVKTRFQPSFFPFTEPSAEVYLSCPFCGAKGCRICKQSGWIELGGSGMVHPQVFEAVREYGYDPAKISGFAFGMGVDRMAALRWDIDDIQLFFHGDVRFLEQFA